MKEPIYHTEDISNKRFLVTGGAGFIGSHIAEYLLNNGAEKVRVLDNLSTGRVENISHLFANGRFEFIEGDIRNEADCNRVVQGVHLISHQAALGSVPRSINDPKTSNEVNVGGFINMLNACKENGIKRIVYASSSSVYGDSHELPKVEERIGKPKSPYAVTKVAKEMYARIYGVIFGLEVIGLRYFNVFGPRQNINGPYAAVIPAFLQAIQSSENPVIYGNGEQTRDFTYISNVVQANIKAMLSGNDALFGKAFNVACGEKVSLNHLWEKLKEIGLSKLSPVYRSERTGDIKDSLADINQAIQQLAYHPDVTLSEGLKYTYNWWFDHNRKR